jgi:hypothetical protein
VIAGSIVFPLAGYAREPGSSRVANRRRAYLVVTVLALIIVIPLAINSVVTVALARWSVTIQQVASHWLGPDDDGRVLDLTWSGLQATLDVTTADGQVPSISDLQKSLATAIPSFVGVVIDVGQGVEHVVQ